MLKIKDVKAKVKNLYEEHDVEIQAAVSVGACLLTGYIFGYKCSSINSAIGMATMHGDGILKFMDPNTGEEIKTSVEAAKVIKDFYKK